MVGIAAVAWWPAFTLGTWGELFFDDLLALWAASVAAFVFVLVERRVWWQRALRALVLALPSVWLLVSFLAQRQAEDDYVAFLVDVAAITAVLLGIPFTLAVLLQIIWPQFRTETSRRSRWLIIATTTAVVVASYLLGMNHAEFLTCEDFDISGNARPAGCVPFEP